MGYCFHYPLPSLGWSGGVDTLFWIVASRAYGFKREPFHYGKSGCASNHPIRKHFWFTSRGTPADASKIDGAWITKIWHFGERVEWPMGDNPHLWISNLKFLVQMVAVWVEYLSDWVVFCRMLFGHKKTSTFCSILDEGGSECFW